MAIKTSCPQCDASYTLADYQRGKKVRCRQCTNTFVVEERDAPTTTGRNSKLRKDGLQATPQPPARTPPPRTNPSAIRRDRAREDDDEDEVDDRPRRSDVKKKGSGLPMILIIVGGILVVVVLCTGVASVAAYFIFYPVGSQTADNVQNGFNNFQNDIQNQINQAQNQMPDLDPPDITAAVAWMKNGEVDKQNRAADWLARQEPVDARRKEVEPALESLMNSPQTHDNALRAFAFWAGPENVPTLMRYADSNDQWAFGKKGGPCADALVRLQDERAITVFARHLETDHHADAAERLSKFGPKAEKEVLKYMDSPKGGVFNNGEAANEARGLLRSWNTTPDLMLTQAVADLNGPESGTMRNAADYVAKADVLEARRAEVSRALNNALRDKEEQTSKAAAIALHSWGTKENVNDLISAVERGGFGEARKEAMMALAAIKDDAGAEAIAKHLADFGGGGSDAENALRVMGPVAAKAVAPYLTNREAGVRDRAARLMKSFQAGGDVQLDAVVAALSSPDGEQRKAACETLANQKVDPARQREVESALVKVLTGDKDVFSKVQCEAARALGVWGGKDSVPALIAAMNGKWFPGSGVEQAAMDALAKIKDERGVVALLAAATDSKYSHVQEAVKALQDLGQPLVEATLDKALGDPIFMAREKVGVCGILEQGRLGSEFIGTKASLPALQTAAVDSSKSLQTAANKAIAAITKRSP